MARIIQWDTNESKRTSMTVIVMMSIVQLDTNNDTNKHSIGPKNKRVLFEVQGSIMRRRCEKRSAQSFELRALNSVRFPGTAFMQSTSRARFTFKRLLLMITGVTVFPFPVVDRALNWYNAFAQDHDARE